MSKLNLKDKVKERFTPFVDDILENYKEKIHSITITGSALTQNFNPEYSDINSVFVLKKMDLKFLEILAPMGKKYIKKRISAPLIMTPDYIYKSLDVFPLEFLNIKLLHNTLFGEDIFEGLEIDLSDLRYQCERELKVRLIELRQGYISSQGNRKILTRGFINSFSGYIPLFNALIYLLGKKPPSANEITLEILEDITEVNMDPFKAVMKEKEKRAKLSIETLNSLFEDYYNAIEKLGKIADEIKV